MTTIVFNSVSMKRQGINHLRLLEQNLTASSVRVPVTLANRDFLRAIRQAELQAWKDAPGGTLSVNRLKE